jgi:hypothetical protein
MEKKYPSPGLNRTIALQIYIIIVTYKVGVSGTYFAEIASKFF